MPSFTLEPKWVKVSFGCFHNVNLFVVVAVDFDCLKEEEAQSSSGEGIFRRAAGIGDGAV